MEILQRCRSSVVLISVFLCTACILTTEVSGLREETKVMEYYHKLILECNLAGLTDADSIKWSKEGVPIESSSKYHLKDSGRNLTVVKAGEDDVGRYSCEATSAKNTSDNRIDFNVFGKPYIKCPSSLAVVEGTTLRIECTVLGYPTPEVKWFGANGSEFDTKSGRVRFESFKNVSNAAIVIKEAVLEDRAWYNCTAINSANTTSFVTNVRIKDKLAALWPFLGICAEVVVLCTIILIYEKKRNKTELDESDTDQSPEQKNTPDHGKEVRQRK